VAGRCCKVMLGANRRLLAAARAAVLQLSSDVLQVGPGPHGISTFNAGCNTQGTNDVTSDVSIILYTSGRHAEPLSCWRPEREVLRRRRTRCAAARFPTDSSRPTSPSEHQPHAMHPRTKGAQLDGGAGQDWPARGGVEQCVSSPNRKFLRTRTLEHSSMGCYR
jgi:hypothetical protein